MSNKEILAIYKVAEKHWSRPAWLCKLLGWNDTQHGLCWYFRNQHSNYYYSIYSPKLWLTYRTKKSHYHFHTREERLEAIRNVIKDLENEQ
jgi:hypothetical protein